MGKLHQLLAVEKDSKNKMAKIIEECSKTFNQRGALFMETSKTYAPISAEDNDRPDETFEPMQSTVIDKLTYVEDSIKQTIDILIQKERANSQAKADIEIENSDGTKTKLITDVPVTALVQLENVLEDVRNRVYNEIPTLDPAKVWNKDGTKQNVWVANPVQLRRTRKVQEPLLMHPATKEHPAQTQLITTDKLAGIWTTSVKSGALSPKQKSQLLNALEKLIAGIKIARSKANDIEVEAVQIGKTIFNFINSAIKD